MFIHAVRGTSCLYNLSGIASNPEFFLTLFTGLQPNRTSMDRELSCLTRLEGSARQVQARHRGMNNKRRGLFVRSFFYFPFHLICDLLQKRVSDHSHKTSKGINCYIGLQPGRSMLVQRRGYPGALRGILGGRYPGGAACIHVHRIGCRVLVAP